MSCAEQQQQQQLQQQKQQQQQQRKRCFDKIHSFCQLNNWCLAEIPNEKKVALYEELWKECDTHGQLACLKKLSEFYLVINSDKTKKKKE